MKTHRYLWPALVSFDNLFRAYTKAVRGKRLRPDVAAFSYDLEVNLLSLLGDLVSGSYSPGTYRRFAVYDPKPRIISAAPFRDRVVHHAICNILEPIFEATFIHDSYACRVGKGTHAAVDRFSHFARRHAYVLKGDVKRYFPSIDHELLMHAIGRKVQCRRTLGLCALVIHQGTQDTAGRGLPIGNQTSQFFANVYLNPFDHFILEQVRPDGYIRYVDDFVLFADGKGELWEALDRARDFLEGLRLELPPAKCLIQPVSAGTTFLGYRIWPHQRRLVRSSIVRYGRRFGGLVRDLQEGDASIEEVRASINAWLGHAKHADTDGLIRVLLKY